MKLSIPADHDVRIDLGISPNAELRFECCVKCGIDTTDFDDVERGCHLKFHVHMAAFPKSIPHQDPYPKLEAFPRRDNSGWLWS